VIGSGGVLYGTASTGGTLYGVAFSLAPPASPGGAWTYDVLHDFVGGSDGAFPQGNLVIGSGGVLYGTTDTGGTSDQGTVFSLTPPASSGGSWTERVLYSFAGGSDGAIPLAGVAIAPGGILVGTTEYGGTGACAVAAFTGCGTVFKLIPPSSPGGSWTESLLHTFMGADGAFPEGGLVIASGGVLYGSTHDRGTGHAGTVFSLTP